MSTFLLYLTYDQESQLIAFFYDGHNSVFTTKEFIFIFLGMGLNTNRGGGLSTSSSYVQRSQGNLASHARYNTVEQSSSYISNSRSNYATIDASRVRAHGDGLLRAYRNEKASFTVDTRDGGKCYYDSIILYLFIFVYQRKRYVNGGRIWS